MYRVVNDLKLICPVMIWTNPLEFAVLHWFKEVEGKALVKTKQLNNLNYKALDTCRIDVKKNDFSGSPKK